MISRSGIVCRAIHRPVRLPVISLSTSSSQTGSRKEFIASAPHPVSKLRLFKFDSTKPVSERAKILQERRAALQTWNHEYWCENNALFQKKKKQYIQNQLKNQADKDELLNDTSQSHEELASFYKDFLDTNRSKHISYNFEWYKRNLELLWPTFIVALESIVRRR